MKDSYSNLCVFNYGKHSYVIMKSSYKIMYFESINGKYVMPITNFNLYDNEGKSLTLVNQHFFMSQLVNRLNVALRKGYFSNEQDIVKYLNNLKSNSENDVNLNKLFKGSFMNEINEKNFESNKREILKYLDKYRFDTFASYNNVSIFDGSLEKGIVNNVDDQSVNDDVSLESNDSEKGNDEVVTFDDLETESNSHVDNLGEGFNFDTVKSNDSNEFINSNDYFSSLGNTSSQEQVSNDVLFDINSDDTNQVVDDTSVDSVDLSSSVNEFDNSNFQSNANLDNTIFIQGGNFINNEQFNNVEQNVVSQNNIGNEQVNNLNQNIQDNVNNGQFNSVEQNSVSNNNVQNNDNSFINDVSNINVSNQQVLNNTVSTNLENPSVVSDVSSSDPFSLSNSVNSNVSYIDQVKDRMSGGYNKPVSESTSEPQNNVNEVESFGFSSSGIMTGDTVISDNSELPELEQISSEPISDNVVEKKKSHIGIIIFMILLVLALGALSFYLYNYVF